MRRTLLLLIVVSALAAGAQCSLLTATDDLVGGADARAGADGAGVGTDDASHPDAPNAEAAVDAASTGDGSALDGGPAGCTRDEECVDGTCIASACFPKPASIATAAKTIFGMAIVANELYWGHNDEVLKRPLAGGTITRADPNGALGHMAWDANYVYFPRNESISRVPLDGGASSVLYTGVDSPITAVAVAGSDLYFTIPTTLRSIPIGGGTAQDRVAGFTGAEGLHVDGSTLYVADRIAGTISTVPLGGTTATAVLSNVPDVRDMFVDGTTMWLTQGAARSVVRTRSDGKGPLVTIAIGQVGISQVIVTSTSVYWAAGTDVWTVPR